MFNPLTRYRFPGSRSARRLKEENDNNSIGTALHNYYYDTASMNNKLIVNYRTRSFYFFKVHLAQVQIEDVET